MPQDEDLPPNEPDLPDDFDPNNFRFFGFGQPCQGPPHPPLMLIRLLPQMQLI